MSQKSMLIVKAIVKYMSLPTLTQAVTFTFCANYLPVGASLDEIATILVEKTNRIGLLPKLVDGLKGNNPNVEFHRALDRALGVDPELGNRRPLWYNDLMPMRQPMANREKLRDMLFDMFENKTETRRLLTIRGDYPGKSHCRWLIKHIAIEAGIEPVFINLLEDVRTVTEFADSLVDQIGLDYDRYKNRFSTQIRDGKAFNNWLVGESKRFGKSARWVLVIDGLAKDGVPDDLRYVALALAKRALNRDLTNVWVILLDCPVDEALDQPGLVFSEMVDPIDKAEIQKVLAWIAKAREEAAAPLPASGIPPEILNTLNTGNFPMPRAELERLSREIARWWSERP